MTDLMALVLDLVAPMIILVTKPFSLVKLSWVFGLRSICIVIHTWIELLKAAISLHLNILCKVMIWTIALIFLPLRVFTALQRERLLDMHLHAMQAELEYLVWDRKELEERLQISIKERKMVELMLAEVEEEHDQAIIQIEALEGEMQNLKDENHRLKETQGKSLWGSRGQGDTGNNQRAEYAEKHSSPHGVPSWRYSYGGGDLTIQDLLIHKDAWEDEIESKTGSKASGPMHTFKPGMISRNIEMIEVLDQRREVAVLQSLFSAMLSLLVGLIIWEAEDPCMPLVAALFTVVCMSLKSVVDFFFSIKNRTASDAVALLSFNWFILGTLAYPTLPRVACMFTPLALGFLEQTERWIGLSS